MNEVIKTQLNEIVTAVKKKEIEIVEDEGSDT